ncbi:MAG: hypothetical protein M0Q91_00905 [Methanoregula sp.]|nr:hypothetical protein [Methanoregula sp.]
MRYTYSPPLWAVLGCLANIILSVAMIWYLIIFLFSCATCAARPSAYAFFIGFCVILVLSGFELIKLLFTGRKKTSAAQSIVTRIVEIDAGLQK